MLIHPQQAVLRGHAMSDLNTDSPIAKHPQSEENLNLEALDLGAALGKTRGALLGAELDSTLGWRVD